MKNKTVIVKVTQQYKVDPNRPRPKWWDKFLGQTFRCYDECEGWWKLSTWGLKKLSKLKGSKSCSAIIHKGCGVEVLRQPYLNYPMEISILYQWGDRCPECFTGYKKNNQMKDNTMTATEILAEYGIDTMSMDDTFNSQLFHAMERYAEERVKESLQLADAYSEGNYKQMNNKELLMDFLKFHYKENMFRQELTNEQDVDAYLHQMEC